MAAATWRLLFLLGMCLCMLLVPGRPCVLTKKYEVSVMNDLGGRNQLYVQCASRNDHFSNTTVHNAGMFSWTFCDNIIHSTLYWCTLTWNGITTSFESFNDKTRDWCSRCVWVARPDGIYFSYEFPPVDAKWTYSW
ncbi:hypothetical protein M569_05354 [Genlisea aurea]|uniref:S-protein homolog n=1 Tax=Genlisea aurea TaxID=192259 RepID=S8E1B1_9LAMI|nr:hypothetical protein M569_05354 [Genlisea aurea]